MEIANISSCFTNLYYRLVSGSGDIKITKDGKVLLDEMVSREVLVNMSV